MRSKFTILTDPAPASLPSNLFSPEYELRVKTKDAIGSATNCAPAVQVVPIGPGGNHHFSQKSSYNKDGLEEGQVDAYFFEDTSVAINGFQLILTDGTNSAQACTDTTGPWTLTWARLTNVKLGTGIQCTTEVELNEGNNWQHTFWADKCSQLTNQGARLGQG